MHNHIVESIGSWGVVSTRAELRMNRVRGGDIIEIPEEFRKYPIKYKHCKIASVDEDGIASVVNGMGSAFLLQSGNCDISGGPFFGIPVQLLTPTYHTFSSVYWNWGNNSPGAAQGIYYEIYRPVFTLTVHPNDIKFRYAKHEEAARKGKFMHEDYLSNDNYELLLRGKTCIKGEYQHVFRKRASTH